MFTITARRGALIVGITAGALFLSACGGTDAGGTADGGGGDSELVATDEQIAAMDELYQKALDEGQTEAVFYMSGDTFQPIAEKFNSYFPDISVQVVNVYGAEQIARVQSEIASGNRVASGIIGADTGAAFSDEYADEWYEEFVPAGVDVESLPDASTNERLGDRWISAFAPAYGFAYNTTLMDEDEVPTSWFGVLDPEFKGGLIVEDPSVYASTSFALGYLLHNGVFDETDVQALRDQEPVVAADAADAAQRLIAGEAGLGFMSASNSVFAYAQTGAPVAFVAKFDEGSALVNFSVGVLKDGPSPDLAKLLQTWLFTTTGQQALVDHDFVPMVPGAVEVPSYLPDVAVDKIFESPGVDAPAIGGAAWELTD